MIQAEMSLFPEKNDNTHDNTTETTGAGDTTASDFTAEERGVSS